MSDLSLDEILAEIESKKGRETTGTKKKAPLKSSTEDFSIEDILGEAYAPRKRTAIDEKAAKRRAEQKAKAEAARREAEEKERLKEEKRKREEALRAEQARKQAEERERKRKEEEEARKKAKEAALAKERAQEEEKRRKAELRLRKAAEEAEERRRLKQEEERKKAEEAERIAALAAEEQEAARKEAERLRREEEESEKRFATKSVVFEDAPIELPKIEEEEADNKPVPMTPEELAAEKEARKIKVESDAQKRLERELTLEDPDDFISAINPYDISENIGFTRIIETIPAQQLSGDTVGIAGNELKELAKSKSSFSERSVEDIIAGETAIMPDFVRSSDSRIDLDKTFVLGDTAEVLTKFNPDSPLSGGTVELPGKKKEETREIPDSRKTAAPVSEDKPEATAEIPPKKVSTDPLIASINKTLEQKRIEDRAVQSAHSVTEQLERMSRGHTRTNSGFLIEIDKASMPRTGHIPVSDPTIGEQKAKSLASKKKRKITDFVLEDITDDDDFNVDDEDDFDVSDDEGQIWNDLTETHKSLRLRFIILLILTVFLGGITLIQEFGVQINFELFGFAVDFLDKRYNTDGFIFLNLFTGVAGMALCGSAISSGISKLFKGKGDCDSSCAVSCILSLLGGVLHLSNADYLQRGKAYIFIAVALVGLLFNTLGKLSMITRARKNFRFISADENRYYADIVEGENQASSFTKGVVSRLPVLVTMRKTEFLTDFLRKSYCDDKADRISRMLVPLSLAAGLILGLLAYFIPNGIDGMENNIFWASTVMIGFVCIFSPFSLMFMVNNPLKRATKALAKSGSTVLGYSTAEEFSETNAVMVDVATIFPASSVNFINLKPCKLQNSINNISLDQAIILAASLAVKSGSLLSRLFYGMIGERENLLVNIEGCVYEDNMGVMGWYENKRLIMGNREHMKHHSIKVPEMSAIAKYCRGSDAVYLAVGGELSIIFFIRLTPNPTIRHYLQELSAKGVSLIVKTTDSLVTVGKIADLFDIDPEKIKVIGSNLHELFGECTKYSSRGSGAITCNGTFTSLARAILASKKLVKDVTLSQMVMLVGIFLAAVLGAILALSVKTLVFSPAVIIIYNLFWMLPMLLVQAFRKY